MSQTILIAGGAGFLGSHLCDAYVEKGYDVVCVDNLCTGSVDNIAHLKKESRFRFIAIDVSKELPKSISDKKYDIVANLASPASPPHYQRLAIETLMIGSVGTHNLLELARKSNARFFQASTSEVYGDPEVHPQHESYKGSVNCYGPRSMYDEAKRFGEAMVYAHKQKYGTNTFVARFFNTYGPRMDIHDGRVVSNFIVQALQDKPLTVYGKGDQTRSFCYVDDLIEGIVRLIESDEDGPMNLGNPREFTIMELAEMVKKMLGSKSEIVHHPTPGDDPMQRRPVITYANKKLLWEPKIALEDGLVKTIKYFRTRVKL